MVSRLDISNVGWMGECQEKQEKEMSGFRWVFDPSIFAPNLGRMYLPYTTLMLLILTTVKFGKFCFDVVFVVVKTWSVFS